MLVKLTSRNQLTLPKAVMRRFAGTRSFEVRAEKGRIVLIPGRVGSLKAVWRKAESLRLTEKDVENGVRWARKTAVGKSKRSAAGTVAAIPGYRAMKPTEFSLAVGRALRRSAKDARRIARFHGTKIYVMRAGKIVALKP